MTHPLIRDVSDTARWVAAYRAWESSRPDALFHDAFARELAGQRGQQIAEKMAKHGGLSNGWPIITRTKVIDDYLHASIAEGCDCVLNLAAGLDTRPYRLKLPASLRWIEVDLPQMIEYKAAVLDAHRPVCQLERHAIDLADAKARRQVLDEVAASAKQALVISEGLLVYLEAPAARELSRDLMARPALHWWIAELASPGILTRMQRGAGAYLISAPMKFAPDNGIAFFEEEGWTPRDIRSLFKEGARLKRVPWYMRPFAKLPDPDCRNPGQRPWTAVLRLERAAA
jgi:methyltransferase (TIGR00027 family)